MRTYYFAAETKDAMLQWMNAMSLASILQNQTRLVQYYFRKKIIVIQMYGGIAFVKMFKAIPTIQQFNINLL